jgi:hypothetical protein
MPAPVGTKLALLLVAVAVAAVIGACHDDDGGRDTPDGGSPDGGEDNPDGGSPDGGEDNPDGGSPDGGEDNPDGDTPVEVDPDCSSVRLTQYWSTTWGWCEFPSDRDFLPDFARRGITLAIAEPWANGSYGGDVGEACGECWEISTSFATQVVMVHDLCPIEGNPLCAGAQFHLDLTPEAAEAVQGGSNDAAVARRVPCPVTGNIHAAILDWNQ